MKWLLAPILAILGAQPVPAAAQDSWGWTIIIPSVTRTDVLGQHLRALEQEDEARRRGSAPPEPEAPRPVPGTAPPVSADALRYTPSPERRQANFRRYLAELKRVAPENAADLERVFDGGRMYDQLDGIMRPYGLTISNAADAYALWWITAWEANHGGIDRKSDRATYQAVRDQAARALVGNPNLAPGDAARQALAERMLIQAVVIQAAVDQSRGDPARMRQLGVAVNRGAREMGLDLSAMTLTSKGFAPL